MHPDTITIPVTIPEETYTVGQKQASQEGFANAESYFAAILQSTVARSPLVDGGSAAETIRQSRALRAHAGSISPSEFAKEIQLTPGFETKEEARDSLQELRNGWK